MILYRTQWITQKMLRYTRNLFVFWKIDLILSWQIRFVVPVFPPNLLRTRFSDFCLVSSLNAFSSSCFYFFFRFCWYFDDFFHFMLLRFTQSKTNGKVENGENTEALFPCFFFPLLFVQLSFVLLLLSFHTLLMNWCAFIKCVRLISHNEQLCNLSLIGS